MAEKWQYGYAIYEEDDAGSISVTVAINSKAPEVMSKFVIAAPGASEEERQERVKAARDDTTLRGLMVVSERRTHNSMFDKKREKSSTEMDVRPCRTDDEAMAVAKAISKLLAERGAINLPLE